MKHIDFEFDGKTYALSFTAEALFTVYDKFGYRNRSGWRTCIR